MPSIDIGEDQADYLEELREALAEAYLEGYGEMRTRDALQYLIDQHEAARGDGPLVDGPPDSSGGPTSADDVGDATADVALESTDAAVSEQSDTGESDADEGDETAADADDADTAADDATSSSSSSGGNPLEQTMQLLEENDDVWTEVDSNDGKYAVELPDGTTEYARTKDDVRALLFKHYR